MALEGKKTNQTNQQINVRTLKRPSTDSRNQVRMWILVCVGWDNRSLELQK